MGASASRQRDDAEEVDDEAGVPLVSPESKKNQNSPPATSFKFSALRERGRATGGGVVV